MITGLIKRLRGSGKMDLDEYTMKRIELNDSPARIVGLKNPPRHKEVSEILQGSSEGVNLINEHYLSVYAGDDYNLYICPRCMDRFIAAYNDKEKKAVHRSFFNNECSGEGHGAHMSMTFETERSTKPLSVFGND